MDTTFMGGASELDAPSAVAGTRQAAPPADGPAQAASDDESGMSSPKCGSDNELDSDREDNEELRQTMLGEDDEPNFDKGGFDADLFSYPSSHSMTNDCTYLEF